MDRIRDARTGQLRNVTDLDSNRVRFNWGFHDGASEARQGRVASIRLTRWGPHWKAQHFDPIYVQGYEAGWDYYQAGKNWSSSLDAWEASGIPEGHAPYRISEKVTATVRRVTHRYEPVRHRRPRLGR